MEHKFKKGDLVFHYYTDYDGVWGIRVAKVVFLYKDGGYGLCDS